MEQTYIAIVYLTFAVHSAAGGARAVHSGAYPLQSFHPTEASADMPEIWS